VAWPDKARQDNRWAFEIPYVLSLLDTHSFTGQVKGLREFPVKDQPPIAITFYAFRIMVALGLGLFLLMVWTAYTWHRGRLKPEELSKQKGLWVAWMTALPLSYLAMEAGWVTREVGRQPWIIYGVLRTEDGASPLAPWNVGLSLSLFAALYLVLFIAFLLLARQLIRQGPETEN
jgi:cytochrome bd ubiquinol oxidase subunit I